MEIFKPTVVKVLLSLVVFLTLIHFFPSFSYWFYMWFTDWSYHLFPHTNTIGNINSSCTDMHRLCTLESPPWRIYVDIFSYVLEYGVAYFTASIAVAFYQVSQEKRK